MDQDAGAVSRRALLLGGLGAAASAIGVGAAVEWDNPRFVRLRGGCGDTPPVPHSTYAVTTGAFESDAMRSSLPWSVALPADQRPGDGTPVVLCLTGLGDGPATAMTRIGFPGFATAAGLRLAFAAPGGGGNRYWHPRADGRDPLAWAVDEFLPMVEDRFGVGGGRNRRAALGWSMGGYGVLLVAQQRPGLVDAAVALSPAVFPSYAAARSGHDYTFDSAQDWERYGVWQHLGDLAGTAVRIDCGGADPFAPTARELLRRIPGAVGGIGSGCHDDGFWRRSTPAALRFIAAHADGSAQ
jgi:S-formylglutathione hydrolase FrmB